MKQKLIITLGLPASGKSTYAKTLAEIDPKNIIRVCRDDIRNMLGPYWVPSREKEVTMIENSCVDIGLHKGYTVIVDATNFSSMNKWKELVKDFTSVPIETCINRDQQRSNSVGKIVIERMYDKYLRK